MPALIASSWFFGEVIRHSERSDAGAYESLEIGGELAGVENVTPAWVRLLTPRTARRRSWAGLRRYGAPPWWRSG